MGETPRKRKDPIFGAAVLKLLFRSRHDEQSPQYLEIYRGVLRDLSLTDEEVERYLEANRPAVEEAIRARLRGEEP
jgi:hypothetical protein